MNPPSEKDLRDKFDQFVSRAGHGAIKELVDLTGLSRPTISRYKAGHKIDSASTRKLASALASLDLSESGERGTHKTVITSKMMQDFIEAASDRGYSIGDISSGSGVPIDTIAKFQKGESVPIDRILALRSWLKSIGIPLSEAGVLSANSMIAQELRTLADVLESPSDYKIKQKRFQSFIDAYAEAYGRATTLGEKLED